eukprot:TRINITY_DN2287_c0_g1_i1.p1 TRINITY_DN2287_c0_g1~~TRINITY_DN2287_c0_g1_i1.p1  ORF type:complete len:442 (+),score=86.26 TRINITY_DN2287_c0_g1_i1:316-1641(+)
MDSAAGRSPMLTSSDGAVSAAEEDVQRDAIIEEQQRKIAKLAQELAHAQSELSRLKGTTTTTPAPRKEAQPKTSRYWTDAEHQRFLEAMEKFGSKNVKAIAQYVGTRSATQVRTHAQKYFLKLKREREKRSYSQSSVSGRSQPLGGSPVERGARRKNLVEAKQLPMSSSTSSLPTQPPYSPHAAARDRAHSPYGSPTEVRRKKRNSWRSHVSDPQELTDAEFHRFAQGLEATKGNKDFDRRCKIIRDLYLSERSLEDVRTWAMLLEKAGADTAVLPSEIHPSVAAESSGLGRPRAFTDPFQRMIYSSPVGLDDLMSSEDEGTNAWVPITRDRTFSTPASLIKQERRNSCEMGDDMALPTPPLASDLSPHFPLTLQEPSPHKRLPLELGRGAPRRASGSISPVGSEAGLGSEDVLGGTYVHMDTASSPVYVDPRHLMPTDPA